MCRFREQALLACTISVFLLVITAGFASAQDVPSHTQVSPAPSGGFDFPAQLTFFASLASYSNGIISNVTQGNFTNASALLGDYNRTIDDLNAAANNPQQDTAIVAMTASRDDLAAFIKNAQRYNDLYVNETSLIPVAARSNGSIGNALEMKALSGTLKGLKSTIEGRNADIYSIAVDNGLDLFRYGNSTALFNAYTTQVDSRLANVTASVFQTPTITLAGNTNSVTYADALVLAGSLQDNQTGVTNSSVELHVDNTTVATVRTNATGSYAYQLVIRTTAPGAHVAFATYAPVNAPYNPAQSPKLNFSVEKLPVTNTLSFLSGSIALGSDLEARGQLTTQHGPVTNATVALVLGGSNVAHTQTDQNGTYAFSVPAIGYYLPSVLSGTTAYTVFDPSGQPLDRVVSTAVHIPTDLTAAYGMIAGVVAVVLLSIFLFSRKLRRKASAVSKEAALKPAEKLPIEGGETVGVPPAPATMTERKPEGGIDWSDVIEHARDLFRQGNDKAAIDALYDAAMAALSTTAQVRLLPSMTHWERHWAIEAAMPDVGTALRELTKAYELVHYSGRSLTEEGLDHYISAFDALRGHVQAVEKHP